MKYVVMVSHGEFAPGLHSAVKMMTGDKPEVLSTSLKDGMGTPEFEENFKALIAPITADDEIILLADILGGSPFTTSLGVLSDAGLLGNTLAIAGMNMPLAVTAVVMKDALPLDLLKDTLISEGQGGLTVYEIASADESEDDDI